MKDPVCGMAVTMQSPHVTLQDGTTVYFCGAGCKAKFLATPANYSSPGCIDHSMAPEVNSPARGAIYTCPMHPRIRKIGPGSCPICGMALEPDTPALDNDADPELKNFRRRFFWTLPLTVMVAIFAMTGHRVLPVNGAMQSWIELALSLPVVIWAGWPFFVRALQSLSHGRPNMWTLI